MANQSDRILREKDQMSKTSFAEKDGNESTESTHSTQKMEEFEEKQFKNCGFTDKTA